jgi:hypothetical protein
MLTADRCNELFVYRSTTGRLIWKPRLVFDFKTPQACRSWNTRFAGTEAGYLRPDGYRIVSVDYQNIMVHQIAWCIYYGAWPSSDIDHRNGDGSDNRIRNLRLATVSQNARNRRKRSDNTSGVTGVRQKLDGKWTATVARRHLGTFDTMEAAVAARRAAEKPYGFTKRHG